MKPAPFCASSRAACGRVVAVSIAALMAAFVDVHTAVPASGSAATDGALAPYSALARSPAAATLLALARAAIERHWELVGEREGRPTASAPDTAQATAWPAVPVAVYVSLVSGHATRACVGREGTSFATLSDAVQALAVEALAADRRRPPVRCEELSGLRLVITFAGEGEPIADPMLADPARQGLSISTPRGFVAFLPGEARTVAWALREARRIGVLTGSVSAASYRRFPVVLLSEPEARASAREARDEGR